MGERRSFLARIASMLILFAMVPTMFLMVALLHYNNTTRHSAAVYRAEQELDNLETQLAVLLNNVENTATVLASDQTLNRVSNTLRRGATLGGEIDAYKDIRELISLLSINDDIGKVRLYLPDGKLVTRQQMNIFGLSDLQDEALPERMNSRVVNCGWTLEEDGAFAYYYRAAFTNRSNAVIALEVSKDALQRVFQRVSSMGKFVLCYDGREFFSAGKEEGDIVRAKEMGDWTLQASMISDAFVEMRVNTFGFVLGMILAMLPIIPLLALRFSRTISRAVNELAQANQALTRQEYTHIPEKSNVRELYWLQHSHNQMVDAIQSMIYDVYEARHARDEAEMTCLFEQVKPHFLYNTLEGGKWLAMQEHAVRTTEFLEKLSLFYRIGLSQGRTFVCLSQELEHVKQYVDLMNLRYSGRILLEIHAQCDVENVRVLKLILQPLVENSVEHGLHLSGRDGSIEVCASIQEGMLEIDVRDTGSGIPQEMCDRLNAGEACGYGLDNVRKRLRIYYGETARLWFENPADGGFRAHISVPCEMRET